MNDLLIRHLLGHDVTIVDGRKPQAAQPRYRGRLAYDPVTRRYSVGLVGLDLITFRLASVMAVEGPVITLGDPVRLLKITKTARGIEMITTSVIQWPL